MIDLWNTNMKRAARMILNARTISMLGMNACTKTGNATRFTDAKTANERCPEV